MATIPSDTLNPLFGNQWHLRNTTPDEFDLNVVDVWDDYTGAGVEVAIIDDAVQRTHPDLDANYSTFKDWDFLDNDTDPSGENGNNHGTAVAGIIGANANNSIGGVGVAYGSTIFGFRIGFDGTNFHQNITTAINNASGITETAGRNREADIVNLSVGTNGSFLSNSVMDELNTAIDNAAISGRNGLGTILVKSAGNDRTDNRDTNDSSWNANKYTISVAAVDRDGFVSDYSTHGASLLVSAFGTPGQVVTTDREGSAGYNTSGDYTFGFDGTSAAAPMVSGVVALMLEANSSLGWRDVQEILAYSARHVGSEIGSDTSGDEEYAWGFNNARNWNGGGLHFSNDYGFGLVDAKAAVRLAETWTSSAKTSANDVNAIETWNGNPVIVPDGNSNGLDFVLNENTANILIEHFELRMNFETTYTGDVEITVTSPSGTSSRLIDNSGGDTDFNGNWTFTSNAFRGEQSSGLWTINVVDSSSRDTLKVNDFSIYSWGSPVSNDDTFIFTNEYSDYAGLFGHTTSIIGGLGTDKINAAAVDSNTNINLDAGVARIDGVNLVVSGIEDIVTGDGNDYLVGNFLNNQIFGMRGNDTIKGEGGNDLLRGGLGNDVLEGGSGDDTIQGTAGYNLLYGGLGKDFLMGGSGNDTMYGEEDDDIMYGFEGNDYLYGGDGSDRLFGRKDHDYLMGDSGNDFLDGGSDVVTTNTGNDTLNGGLGADEMKGRDGNDRYYVDHFADTVIENSNEGIDSVFASINYTLTNNVENLFLLLNSGSLNGTGNSLNNQITGNNAENFLDGLDGNDILFGHDGNDFILGGSGNDYIDGGEGYDEMDGGAGIDTLDVTFSDRNYELDLSTGETNLSGEVAVNFENVNTGAGKDKIIGNSSNNIISTGAGKDKLEGEAGNDTLYGGADDDKLYGDEGNDYLYGNSGKDKLEGGIGNDFLSGGDDNDELKGEEGNDTLYGGSGNDKLEGKDGDDTLYGDSGEDKLKGGKGDDVLFGGDGNDELEGEDGNDELYGRSGDDRLKGKDGDDELFGDSGEDRLDGGDGDDYLAGGSDNDRLDGDRGNDRLTGDSGDDTLKGDRGDDLLSGDSGNDYLEGNSGADRFIFYSWNEGTDTIKDFDGAEGDRIEIHQYSFGIGAEFSYDSNSGDLFFNGSDTVNGTYHLATLEKNSDKFDLDRHLILV